MSVGPGGCLCHVEQSCSIDELVGFDPFEEAFGVLVVFVKVSCYDTVGGVLVLLLKVLCNSSCGPFVPVCLAVDTANGNGDFVSKFELDGDASARYFSDGMEVGCKCLVD